MADGDQLHMPVYTAAGHIRRIRDVEADLIRIALAHYQGNCRLAAQHLGIARGTLYRKIDEFQIARRASAD